ncbi:unknown [Collinsella sp. CAG:398]|nr:unknown [Collinsella sp. CAG:398]
MGSETRLRASVVKETGAAAASARSSELTETALRLSPADESVSLIVSCPSLSWPTPAANWPSAEAITEMPSPRPDMPAPTASRACPSATLPCPSAAVAVENVSSTCGKAAVPAATPCTPSPSMPSGASDAPVWVMRPPVSINAGAEASRVAFATCAFTATLSAGSTNWPARETMSFAAPVAVCSAWLYSSAALASAWRCPSKPSREVAAESTLPARDRAFAAACSSSPRRLSRSSSSSSIRADTSSSVSKPSVTPEGSKVPFAIAVRRWTSSSYSASSASMRCTIPSCPSSPCSEDKVRASACAPVCASPTAACASPTAPTSASAPAWTEDEASDMLPSASDSVCACSENCGASELSSARSEML